jgi:hypothetical protein
MRFLKECKNKVKTFCNKFFNGVVLKRSFVKYITLPDALIYLQLYENNNDSRNNLCILFIWKM